MDREQRISAGAIVIQNGAILLVRYRKETGENYLVSPGGGVLNDNDTVESITEAVVRRHAKRPGWRSVPRGSILLRICSISNTEL
jgi:ADP-ribose pyrophosphatase YjhB (NUDIX family)